MYRLHENDKLEAVHTCRILKVLVLDYNRQLASGAFKSHHSIIKLSKTVKFQDKTYLRHIFYLSLIMRWI